jgi:sulfite exporter TauE/SafE
VTEYLLIFAGGLLGSAHCVGMCGAFMITLAGQHGLSSNAVRQLTYNLGRVCTYALAGAFVGYFGRRVGLETRSVVVLQAALSCLAGTFLILEGLWSGGWLRRPWQSKPGCPGASSFASLLRAREWPAVFAAGTLNGLLPCGLVYAYLALAASRGDMLGGVLTMTAFGLGTLPLLVLTGLSGHILKASLRRWVFGIAAACMIATGVLAIGRGAAFYLAPTEAACPLCEGE